MKIRQLDPDRILSIPCPTCGAQPEQKCELATGQPLTNPHRSRRLDAKDTEMGIVSRFVDLDELTGRRVV